MDELAGLLPRGLVRWSASERWRGGVVGLKGRLKTSLEKRHAPEAKQLRPPRPKKSLSFKFVHHHHDDDDRRCCVDSCLKRAGSRLTAHHRLESTSMITSVYWYNAPNMRWIMMRSGGPPSTKSRTGPGRLAGHIHDFFFIKNPLNLNFLLASEQIVTTAPSPSLPPSNTTPHQQKKTGLPPPRLPRRQGWTGRSRRGYAHRSSSSSSEL